ncbi:hypothetical protein ACVGVM_08970 [Pseudonocardia bannensis]|uniref:Uncharacterized protein n=1 Tax=Pseudonocardia bannensis TaxID=630973 RepID=A0A848DC01_9PSEU|nr:hypothetical protein [Pseudonocardia bannensis]NMH90268.1 hypothetical protein [Pseudonocardia bannensis]
MHPHRLEQLVASVPATIGREQRARLTAHADASDSCRCRIQALRTELELALDGREGSASALDLACELDKLERVQQRVDGWLTALVEELTRTPYAVDYGDGVPA